jgi:hypothetical protein
MDSQYSELQLTLDERASSKRAKNATFRAVAEPIGQIRAVKYDELEPFPIDNHCHVESVLFQKCERRGFNEPFNCGHRTSLDCLSQNCRQLTYVPGLAVSTRPVTTKDLIIRLKHTAVFLLYQLEHDTYIPIGRIFPLRTVFVVEPSELAERTWQTEPIPASFLNETEELLVVFCEDLLLETMHPLNQFPSRYLTLETPNAHFTRAELQRRDDWMGGKDFWHRGDDFIESEELHPGPLVRDILHFTLRASQGDGITYSTHEEGLDTHLARLPSWASIVASVSTEASSLSLAREASKESLKKEIRCLRIRTQPKPYDADTTNTASVKYLPTALANTSIRNALLGMNATKDVQLAWIGKTKTGYMIRFKNQQSAEIARANSGWLEELGNGTTLIEPRFGIVVHYTPTDDISLPEKKMKCINRIIEENQFATKGYWIEDIAWLKSKNKPLGRTASLGIWLDTAEAAEWIIQNGLVFGQRYISSIESYKVKRKRSYRY